MKLVDASVLVYAVNADAVHHHDALTWLDESLAGARSVGLAWVPLLAFVRLVTRAGLFPSPLSVTQAMGQVQGWLSQPGANVVQPTGQHPAVLAQLLAAVGSRGNLLNDAHLAALAIEHRAQVVTYDRDLDRFPGVQIERPSR